MSRKSADREVRESRAEIARRAAKAPKPPKAPKVAKERKPREKPVRTIRVRVAELGEHHLAAFDHLRKKDESLEAAVKAALDAADLHHEASAALVTAHNAVVHAEQRAGDMQRLAEQTGGVLGKLDVVAAKFAEMDEDFGPSDLGAVPTNA